MQLTHILTAYPYQGLVGVGRDLIGSFGAGLPYWEHVPLALHMPCIEFLIPDQNNFAGPMYVRFCTKLVDAYISTDFFVHGLRHHDPRTFISYALLYWQFLPLIPVRTQGLWDNWFVFGPSISIRKTSKWVTPADTGCGRDYWESVRGQSVWSVGPLSHVKSISLQSHQHSLQTGWVFVEWFLHFGFERVAYINNWSNLTWVRYFSCHSNMRFISSRYRVTSSISVQIIF